MQSRRIYSSRACERRPRLWAGRRCLRWRGRWCNGGRLRWRGRWHGRGSWRRRDCRGSRGHQRWNWRGSRCGCRVWSRCGRGYGSAGRVGRRRRERSRRRYRRISRIWRGSRLRRECGLRRIQINGRRLIAHHRSFIRRKSREHSRRRSRSRRGLSGRIAAGQRRQNGHANRRDSQERCQCVPAFGFCGRLQGYSKWLLNHGGS